MDTINIESNNADLSFSLAKALADDKAASDMEEPILLSWYDKKRNKEYPPGVSECHDAQCTVPGCVGYAQSREGKIIINIDKGDYLFCYRELGEFADC